MDEDNELSFKSFISSDAPVAPATPEAAPIAAPQITDPVPAQEAVGSTATDGSAANTTPVAPVAPVVAPVPETPEQRQVRLQDVFAKRGWQLPDGIDEESLYETTADRVQQAIELQAQLNLRNKELEDLKARLSSTPAVAPQVQTVPAPAPAPQPPKPSRFGLLNEPPGASREYVTKSASGSWVVKPEYAGSQTAFAAAEEWNDYERQSQERANMLIKNPKAAWDEEIKPEFEQLVDQRARSIFEEYQKKQAEEAQARAQADAQTRQAQEAQAAMAKFDQEHAQEFYQLDASGRPLMIFGTDQPVVTPFFQQFLAQHERIASKYPALPPTEIAQLAYDFTKMHAPVPVAPVAPAAPAAPAPTPEQIQQQTADKKQRFVDQRTEPAKAPVNMQPASITDMSAPPGNRFMDYIMQDQENASNPVWQQMRSR